MSKGDADCLFPTRCPNSPDWRTVSEPDLIQEGDYREFLAIRSDGLFDHQAVPTEKSDMEAVKILEKPATDNHS